MIYSLSKYGDSFAPRSFFIGLLLLLSNVAIAGDILDPIRRDTPHPDYGATVPEKVSGRVTSDGAGVEAVSVSDGYTVVKTDSEGRFLLKPDSRSVFVFLTKPRGYSVVGDWYQAVESKVDFKLKLADENDFYFIHVTDTHTSNNKLSQEGLSQFVREVNSLSPNIRFSGEGDEMGISHVTLRCGDTIYRDTRDEAIRDVKSKHWGPTSVDWGAYIVGDGHLGENSFTFKRNAFLFVIE